MPAGYGTRCEKCYWARLLEKRIAINAGVFGVPTMAQHFSSFGKWLANRTGDHRAAIALNRYLPFFTEVEREWQDVPTYSALLDRFGVEKLRRFRLPMAWLSEVLGIEPNIRVREENSEQQHINVLMGHFSQETLAAKTLDAYREMLNARLAAGRTTLRSIRLALRPAVSLLLAADDSGKALPNQAVLDRYVHNVPGQMAALTGFVNLLNQRYVAGLSLLRSDKRRRVVRKKRLEDELAVMIRNGQIGATPPKEWTSAALEYFHGVPRNIGRLISADQIVADESGCTVVLNGQQHWIPSLVAFSRVSKFDNKL